MRCGRSKEEATRPGLPNTSVATQGCQLWVLMLIQCCQTLGVPNVQGGRCNGPHVYNELIIMMNVFIVPISGLLHAITSKLDFRYNGLLLLVHKKSIITNF